VAPVASHAFDEQLHLIDGQRRCQRFPVFDDVGGLTGGRQVDGDGPALTDSAGAFDQAQGFVFADEFGVAEGVDQDLRVHGPGQ